MLSLLWVTSVFAVDWNPIFAPLHSRCGWIDEFEICALDHVPICDIFAHLTESQDSRVNPLDSLEASYFNRLCELLNVAEHATIHPRLRMIEFADGSNAMHPVLAVHDITEIGQLLINSTGIETVSNQRNPLMRFQMIWKWCTSLTNKFSQTNCENTGFCQWGPSPAERVDFQCRPNLASLIHDSFVSPLDLYITAQAHCDSMSKSREHCLARSDFVIGDLRVEKSFSFLLIASSLLIGSFLATILLCPMPTVRTREFALNFPKPTITASS